MKTRVAFCVGLLAVAAGATAQSGPVPLAAPAFDRAALLIVDIQNFYFAGGRIPLVGSVEASLKAKAVLERFRDRKIPVVHIQHLPQGTGKFEPGTTDPQYDIHPNVAPLPGEIVVAKHFANSFRDTGLQAVLKDLGVRTLVIVGMQTHMCVEAAARAGADLGYDIIVVEDACATRDLKHGDTTVPAASVHAAVLAALSGSYARVAPSAEVLAALK
jgi:nicotinamidase-related amidase